MHHYPLAKGDALCPLGFHPQVRWPTRCKRCFRDYKEHGGKKKEDDFTASTPALGSWGSPASRGRDENGDARERSGRSWSSSTNLSQHDKKDKTDSPAALAGGGRPSSSWTSTPDLNETTTAVTVSLKLPKRRLTSPLEPTDTGQTTAPETSTVTLRRPSPSPPPSSVPAHLIITKNDSLAERVRKMQLLKAQNSFEKESSQERSTSRSREEDKAKSKEEVKSSKTKEPDKNIKDDLNFLIQVKNARNSGITKPPIRGGPIKDKEGYASDDDLSTTGTTTTEGTLVDANVREYQDQIEGLKQEVDILKKRCERVEKEKSDILLRRLANLDTSKTGRSSEVLKLQQKVNDLTSNNEDLKDEKKHLSLRVKELEAEIEARPSIESHNKLTEQLRAKLLAAETLCEELMDENEDMKKELRDLEEEIEEMQDNFREDQADEYSSLRRELEQSIKNCRVLSFKLKKSERRVEQLEQEKAEQEKKLLELAGGASGLERVARIKELETELSRAGEVALRLQRELHDVTAQLQAGGGIAGGGAGRPRAPPLAVIGRNNSAEGKVSRASLTRGGSQEDPQQLLRDLQDSLEREADLREQLKNAEEEANNLRKTASRVEDDNESLVLQLKKMATKARTRKLSPTPPPNRLSIDNSIEKDEGISDEEDPAELRILLELNEQEAAVLRRKVEELEQEGDSLRRQVKDLADKLSTKTTKTETITTKKKSGNLAEEKIKVLEDEIAELRKKLIEKERDCERLHSELSLAQKKPKGVLIKSKSLDTSSEQQNLDLKRQLQVIEQEANVLRTKTQALENDNEKLQAENKKLQLLKNTKSVKSEKSLEISTEKVTKLETELKEALKKIKEFESKDEKPEKRVSFGGVISKKDADALKIKQEELDKLKLNFTKLEKENLKLTATLKELKENAIKSFKPRIPKKMTDLTTKLQMKKMVEELENEIGEMYVIMKNAEINKSPDGISEKNQLLKDIEDIRLKLSSNVSEHINEKNKLESEIAKLKDLNKKLDKDKGTFSIQVKNIEEEKKRSEGEYKTLQETKIKLESQIEKLNSEIKNFSNKQTVTSDLMKKVEELKKQLDTRDKEVEALKKQVEVKEQLEQDKSKLLKETGDKAKKIMELEKKLKESDDKLKRTEKQLGLKKDRVVKLEKELSEEKVQVEAISESKRRLSVDFVSEKDEIQTKLLKAEMKVITLEGDIKEIIADSETKIVNFESDLAAKDCHIKQLEDALRETSNQKYDDAVSAVELAHLQEELEKATKDLKTKEGELASIKKEMEKNSNTQNQLRTELNNLKLEMDKEAKNKKEAENNIKVQKREAEYWESKAAELDTDLQAERKKVERMRIAHDKDTKNKEAELATLKGKLKILEQTSGAGTKMISELKQEHEENIKKLEHTLAVERAEYDELTGKYELLEEEHVVVKAKLTVEKETAQGDLIQVQKELNSVSATLRSLQETHSNKSDAWAKEKNELQDEISRMQERLCGGGWEVEKARLTARLEQKERELRLMADQHTVTLHQQEALRREVEDARTKLDDYERLNKVQRNQVAQNAEIEREMKTLQERLDQAERVRKSEVSECKLRYDSQMQSMQDELKSLQNQVSRFKRERDTYKQMLDKANKSVQDMRSGDSKLKRGSISSVDEEEYRGKLQVLEQQVACLEDELCEARLAASRARTDLVSERSSAEVKLAEMQSRLNENEEERLLASGRSRVAGMATRMELAWQKERDEQQRLLQETSTLARDLRQTLFEMERERDKERLDMKRRIDQLKKTTEEETDENKKKVTELQCDLLELRDAHAKLRTTNEKLRRDKERHDREREQNKLLVASLKRAQQDDDRKTSFLLETVDDLMRQAPHLFSTAAAPSRPDAKNLLTPTPPRRHRSKSRSREATPESAESGAEADVSAALGRLQRAAQEVRATRLLERQRRQAGGGARRAASTEPRDNMTATVSPRANNSRTPSLKKRSISLEQTTKDQSVIWKSVDEGSVSSIQSLDGDVDSRLFTLQRDTSLDSRLSGGSTQSDVLVSGEKKKKKGLFGKLKQLTKSRSVDDHNESDLGDFKPIGTVSQGSDSDMSAAGGSKRDIRGRLSGMFHRKGHSSKEGSRELCTPLPERSALRPLSRDPSTANIQRADLQASTSQRSDASSSSRGASMTPAVKRKGK